jgi:hypothetical protein
MKNIRTKEEKEMLDSIIRDYAKTWTLLFQYDQGILQVKRSKTKEKVRFCA